MTFEDDFKEFLRGHKVMFATKIQTSGCYLLGLLLATCFGCQSLTRNQQVWQSPKSGEELSHPILEMVRNEYPPLPDASLPPFDETKPVPKVFSLDPKPVMDRNVLVTSAQISQKTTSAPTRPQSDNSFQSQSGNDYPVRKILTPDSTKKVVEKLVSGSQELTPPVSGQESNILDMNLAKVQTMPEREPESSKSPSETVAILSRSPSLETLPPLRIIEQSNQEDSTGLFIPRAAICRSIQGRGNFTAMPSHRIVPGSTVLVYWEMDGLQSEKLSHHKKIAARLELIDPEFETILASVHQSIEKEDDEVSNKDQDFAVLKWQIPNEVSPGEYRLVITTTDQTSKMEARHNLMLMISGNSQ